MANVLVVSDDVWVDNDVRASLTDPGTVISSVADPRAAADAAEEHSADVAIIDLQVGSMGGMAVVRALRTAVDLDDLHPLRLILLLDRDADKFLAHRAGADVAVVKPFTAQDLRAAVGVPAPA